MKQTVKKAKRFRPWLRRRPPEGMTPEDVARNMGFIPPHQRPEVLERMREREARQDSE
ncbi:MAG: hypothetical protein OXP70_14200 [Acidobacteriota bacterium]|nr:hypothetical protein [Acidobacteriota bacterium]